MHSISCANTYHDITDFEIEDTERNVKNHIFQEQNMTLT